MKEKIDPISRILNTKHFVGYGDMPKTFNSSISEVESLEELLEIRGNLLSIYMESEGDIERKLERLILGMYAFISVVNISPSIQFELRNWLSKHYVEKEDYKFTFGAPTENVDQIVAYIKEFFVSSDLFSFVQFGNARDNGEESVRFLDAIEVVLKRKQSKLVGFILDFYFGSILEFDRIDIAPEPTKMRIKVGEMFGIPTMKEFRSNIDINIVIPIDMLLNGRNNLSKVLFLSNREADVGVLIDEKSKHPERLMIPLTVGDTIKLSRPVVAVGVTEANIEEFVLTEVS